MHYNYIKGFSHSFRITCNKNAVSLRKTKSREWCHIGGDFALSLLTAFESKYSCSVLPALLLLALTTSIQHKPAHWCKMNHLLCSCFKCLAKSMHACTVVYTVLSLVFQWHTITCSLIIWTQTQVVTCFIFISLQYVTYILYSSW